MRRLSEAPRTTEDHVNSMTSRIEKLERRNPMALTVVYVAPEPPENVPVGTLWFDTDEPI